MRPHVNVNFASNSTSCGASGPHRSSRGKETHDFGVVELLKTTWHRLLHGFFSLPGARHDKLDIWLLQIAWTIRTGNLSSMCLERFCTTLINTGPCCSQLLTAFLFSVCENRKRKVQTALHRGRTILDSLWGLSQHQTEITTFLPGTLKNGLVLKFKIAHVN